MNICTLGDAWHGERQSVYKPYSEDIRITYPKVSWRLTKDFATHPIQGGDGSMISFLNGSLKCPKKAEGQKPGKKKRGQPSGKTEGVAH